MMTIFTRTVLFITLIAISISFYAFLNGSFCHYNISITNKDKNTFLTCYRGKVVALHSKKDNKDNYLSQWKVEARQLKLGNQLIYFIYSRTLLIDDQREDSNDHFNKISSGYRFLFYGIIRKDNKLYIFQRFPNFNVLEAEINGTMDFWGTIHR